MAKAIIKLTYRYIIDAFSTTAFDREVWRISYEEFLLKSQAYNPEKKFNTFTELKTNDGRANSLHYKCGFGISGFIEKLNKKMPLLEDCLGKPIAFDNYNFELIESNIMNQQQHKVAIHFTTNEFTLHDSIGDHMILSEKTNSNNNLHESFTLQLQPNLSVVNYEEIKIS